MTRLACSNGASDMTGSVVQFGGAPVAAPNWSPAQLAAPPLMSSRTESRRPCRRACRPRPWRACAPASRLASRNRRRSPAAPPPPPRVSSMVSVELKFCSTTSVEYFSMPSLSVYLRVCNWPFEINLRALLQILLDDLAEPFTEDHHAVPFGLFLALAGGLVAPALRGRDAQIGDRAAVLGAPDFRVRAEIADQNDLVHRACHDILLLRIHRADI